MGKRRAATELNRDNWDDDQHESIETEDSEQADTAILATRKILVPKSCRTNIATGLFKSLSGFSNSSELSNFSFNLKPIEPAQPAVSSKPYSNPENITQEIEYLKELQTLNHNLLEWVEKHVKSDPHCILSPVFVDYEKHLKHLHEKFPSHVTQNQGANNVRSNSPTLVTSTCSLPKSVFEDKPAVSTYAISTESQIASSVFTNSSAKPFSFLLPPLTASTSTPPLFKFGSSLPTSSPFAKPSVSTEQTVSPEEDDTEVYQPPKPFVREIKEDGSVYSIRCKLFYKKESEWRERGVGNLFIKPQPENKFQLLIRAETNLGNILLNVMITKEIPVRLQKNSVTLFCVPSPPVSTTKTSSNDNDAPDPVLMLIRLKTEEAANELLKQIDRYRGMGEKNDE